MSLESRCLHELFEDQARRTPGALAVVDPEVSLTYKVLDRQAERLAAYLRSIGVRPGVSVGIYMERRTEYIVACLAALKAGGAYLTLELAYPTPLLADSIADAGPRIVLTRGRYVDRLPAGVDHFSMDGGWENRLEDAFSSGDGVRVSQDDPAFVSYSAGTTGKPKGITNPHRAPVRSYLWRFGVSDYAPGDRVGCNVFFIWEMLRPLLRGAATVVIPDDVIYDPKALVDFLEEYEVTETLVTPSLLEAVMDASGPDVGDRLSALKTVWLNGEVVTRTLARRAMSLLPEARLLNVYSCSETHEVAAGDLRELVENPHSTYCAVGRPMDPERLYILDEAGERVPEGKTGELFVGGECLARGYVNLPEKTEESFPKDPFSPEEDARMYRTGDKARILPDGSLEIMGRVDFMVKIRGYSVELGAVEAAIERNLAVRACVVVSEGKEGEDKRLVAYLVPDPEVSESDSRYSEWHLDPKTGRSPEIRNRLRESLPHYAVPAVFVELESLPIQTTSGKVDRHELPPPPPRPARSAPDPERTSVTLAADASRSEKEASLAGIWEEILRLEPGEVRPEDDFFDLGGHSLAAAQLSGRIGEGFGVHVSMPLFMEEPTLGGLCDRIEALQRDEPGVTTRISPDELSAEASLEEDIAPESGVVSGTKPLHDARSIFLTGATGFLGAFLLEGLLSTTEADVHCLVRPRDGQTPLETVQANLRGYGLEDAARSERVVAVAGDLTSPSFGMSATDFDALSREVEVVIHAGAAVNLAYPYSALRAANVDGTREVLRLACRDGAKPVHYVSTNGIFPAGAGVCREDSDFDSLADARDDGYGQSKWVAEKLVRQAAERGLPVSVYRPGNVSGHSEMGAANPRDLLGVVVNESIRIEAAPEIEGWRMEMTPVDFVVDAILYIASGTETAGRVYHLANPDPTPAPKFFDHVEETLGYPLERLPHADWLRAVKDSPGPEETSGILHGAALGVEELWDANAYDDHNTREALRDGGPQRPAFDRALISTYAQHFARQGRIEIFEPQRVSHRG